MRNKLFLGVLLLVILVLAGFFILNKFDDEFTGRATGVCVVDGVCDAGFGEDNVNCPEDCGGIIVVRGGVTENIPLGKAIVGSTTYGFDWSFIDSDIEKLQDTQINFQNKLYDIHEELVLSNGSGPSVETSLTSQDDDYMSNVFLEVVSKGINYYYVFDDRINISKATVTEPLTINFLGKNITIVNVNSNIGFTILIGEEYFMDVGDTVTVEGKTVTLENVGVGGAVLVDVDGIRGTISASAEVNLNGIAIFNKETFYTNEMSERSAVLIMGSVAMVTYQDGDAYIGEDENDPDWEWIISGLRMDSATTLNVTQSEFPWQSPAGPALGIHNSFTRDDDTDNPPGVGECYNLPNNYLFICFDSLIVPDNNYLEVTARLTTVDTLKSGAPGSLTNAKVIEISSLSNNGLVINTTGWQHVNNTNGPNGAMTNTIWVQSVIGSNPLLVFYKDPNKNPSVVYAGNVTGFQQQTMAQVNFGDTSGNNVKIKGQSDGSFFDISIEMLGDSISELRQDEDNILSKWLISNGEFVSLGNTNSLEEIDELQWLTLEEFSNIVNLGTKNEDHRTKYGVIIKNPALNSLSDQVVLLIPSDQVKAKIDIGSLYSAGCFDSDNGLNYYIKGSTTFGSETSYDSCVDRTNLIEYICNSDNSISQVSYDCGLEGKRCLDGACVSATSCINGCLLNNACVDIGYRTIIQGEGVHYCTTNGMFIPQKEIGANCQNNFECLSNFCSNNKCVDLVSDIQSNTGILSQILTFLQSK